MQMERDKYSFHFESLFKYINFTAKQEKEENKRDASLETGLIEEDIVSITKMINVQWSVSARECVCVCVHVYQYFELT